MAGFEREVLSEHCQKRMEGRVLKTAVFLTFRFDPGFFEQEVLPVFLDVPLSHDPALRLVQLEEAIRSHVDHLAVYYDRGALEAGSESAKLDVRRIPISWPTGAYFHAKNVLALVEDAEPGETGEREQRLLVATLSANLTRAGWWENVEACHIEELRLGEKSSLRSDVLKLIARIKTASPPGEGHEALRAGTRRRATRTPGRGRSAVGEGLARQPPSALQGRARHPTAVMGSSIRIPCAASLAGVTHKTPAVRHGDRGFVSSPAEGELSPSGRTRLRRG